MRRDPPTTTAEVCGGEHHGRSLACGLRDMGVRQPYEFISHGTCHPSSIWYTRVRS